MHRLEALSEYIKSICNCEKQGGRVLLLADSKTSSLMLMDVGQWNDDMFTCTKHRFPDVSICIQQSRASLSGFCITFSIDISKNVGHKKDNKQKNGCRWYPFVVAMIVCIVFLVAILIPSNQLEL